MHLQAALQPTHHHSSNFYGVPNATFLILLVAEESHAAKYKLQLMEITVFFELT